MKQIMEVLYRVFGGRGIDKKFPVLLWLFKRFFVYTQKECEIVVSTGYGKTLIVSGRDAGLGLTLRTRSDYEPLLTRYLLNTLKAGQVVVDVGANVGYFTKLAASLVGSKGTVIGFEPSGMSQKYLKKNVGRLENVLISQLALSNKDGLASFAEDQANPGENGLQKEGKFRVKTTTLDQWVKIHTVTNIHLLKIDVEGAEALVLEGARYTLRKQKNLVVVCECNPQALYKLGYDVPDLVNALHDCGLEVLEVIDERCKLISHYTPDVLDLSLSQSAYVTLVAKKGNNEK